MSSEIKKVYFHTFSKTVACFFNLTMHKEQCVFISTPQNLLAYGKYPCMSRTMHALSSTWSIVYTNLSTYYKHFTKTGKDIMSCQYRRTFPTISKFSNRRKREIRHFHAVLGQWQKRMVQKKCTSKVVVLLI